MSATQKPRPPKSALRHWDFMGDLTGHQAACLMLGMDPSDPPELLARTLPLLDLMCRSYERAMYPDAACAPDRLKSLHPLSSIRLREMLERTDLDGADLLGWLEGPRGHFSEQHFDRETLARWSADAGVSSLYSFVAHATRPPVTERDQGDAWAKRPRETALKIVAAMAIKGYAFDPRAARSDAPKEIADDATELGISVSAETVRKLLKEACETVVPRPAT